MKYFILILLKKYVIIYGGYIFNDDNTQLNRESCGAYESWFCYFWTNPARARWLEKVPIWASFLGEWGAIWKPLDWAQKFHMLDFGGKTGQRTRARPAHRSAIKGNSSKCSIKPNSKIKIWTTILNAKSGRRARSRPANYTIWSWICQALFFRQIAQKNLGGQSEVFCPFCFTG